VSTLPYSRLFKNYGGEEHLNINMDQVERLTTWNSILAYLIKKDNICFKKKTSFAVCVQLVQFLFDPVHTVECTHSKTHQSVLH